MYLAVLFSFSLPSFSLFCLLFPFSLLIFAYLHPEGKSDGTCKQRETQWHKARISLWLLRRQRKEPNELRR
jgi:hypothetical protein